MFDSSISHRNFAIPSDTDSVFLTIVQRFVKLLLASQELPAICMILAIVDFHNQSLHKLKFEMHTPIVESAVGPRRNLPVCCVNLLFTSFLKIETSFILHLLLSSSFSAEASGFLW